MWWNTVIDEKQLAIDIFLLPRRKREKMLSGLPESRREILESYFAKFKAAADDKPEPGKPMLPVDFSRSSMVAEQLPGGSAALIRRVDRLLAGDDQAFPEALGKALQDYCRSSNEVKNANQR